MAKHALQVTYTIDDDGIHLFCDECEFQRAVGFNPTVSGLVKVQTEHRKAILDGEET